MNPIEKEIKEFPGYTITDSGNVISYKQKAPRIMATTIHSNGYESLKLCKNNLTYYKSVHRMVAEAFIPNPDNLPEVNHKNKIRSDNRVENLNWCTRVENLIDSYETMSPVRNFIECSLFNKHDVFIEDFQSITSAAKYAQESFGCSYSMMTKHKCANNYYLKVNKV